MWRVLIFAVKNNVLMTILLYLLFFKSVEIATSVIVVYIVNTLVRHLSVF